MKKRHKSIVIKNKKNQNVEVKRNGIYYVSNRDLNINTKHGKGHGVVLLDEPKSKSGKVRVKTITSLEQTYIDKEGNKKSRFKTYKISDIKSGKLVVIPQNQINSKVLSAINQSSIEININDLCENKMGYKYPSRYESVIHKGVKKK